MVGQDGNSCQRSALLSLSVREIVCLFVHKCRSAHVRVRVVMTESGTEKGENLGYDSKFVHTIATVLLSKPKYAMSIHRRVRYMRTCTLGARGEVNRGWLAQQLMVLPTAAHLIEYGFHLM